MLCYQIKKEKIGENYLGKIVRELTYFIIKEMNENKNKIVSALNFSNLLSLR
jgi:hypothetical protein